MKHKGIEAKSFGDFCNKAQTLTCINNTDCSECKIAWKSARIDELESQLKEALEVIIAISKSHYHCGMWNESTDDARVALEFLKKVGG